MNRSLRRSRTSYNLSNKASEVYQILKLCFPHSRIFVEYPYSYLLKKHYKSKRIPAEYQDRALLSHTRLHADFFLPDFDCVIEVDGEQHFVPVRFGGISEQQASERLGDQKHRDYVKTRICSEAGYKLIRIRFDQDITQDIMFELIRLRGNYGTTEKF